MGNCTQVITLLVIYRRTINIKNTNTNKQRNRSQMLSLVKCVKFCEQISDLSKDLN